MPSSSVAMRSLALAALSIGAGIAVAQAQNVTAFNPYNGVGLPAGAVPAPGVSAAGVRAAPTNSYPVVDAMRPPPTGMAFNPWQSTNVGAGVVAAGMPTLAAMATPNVVATYSPALPPSAYAPTDVEIYNVGSNLPPPPPGPIRSRIIAIPERGDTPTARRVAAAPSAPPPPPPTAPVTVTANEPPQPPAPVPAAREVSPPPAPVPTSAQQAAAAALPSPPRAPTPAPKVTVATLPAPPPAVSPPKEANLPPPPPPGPAPNLEGLPPPPPPASQPAPPVVTSPTPSVTRSAIALSPGPAPSQVMMSASPPPPPAEAPNQAAANAASIVTVSFPPQSAEIVPAARSVLDELARTLAQHGVKQVELRAYSSGEPGNARKVALARALSVRSYLIDQGVKARIEVGSFTSSPSGGASDRVDVVTP